MDALVKGVRDTFDHQERARLQPIFERGVLGPTPLALLPPGEGEAEPRAVMRRDGEARECGAQGAGVGGAETLEEDEAGPSMRHEVPAWERRD